MRDSGFGLFRHEVEDGGPGRFGPGAGRGGDCDQGKQRFGYGEAEAEGRVYKVEEIIVGEAAVEVHQFCRVDDGPTTDGDEGVRFIFLGKVDCFSDAVFYSSVIPT